MKAARSQSIKKSLPKVPTHIKGLDEILQGGIPKNHVSLIVGGPGSGKSILGMQFLYHEALEGKSGIFITFEEKAETIRHNSMLLGFDLTEVEANNTLYIMEAQLDPAVIVSGDFDIDGLLAMIGALAKKMGTTHIVVDAIDVLLQHFNDRYLERKALYTLHKWLLDHNMTAVMTVKTADHVNNVSHYQFLDYLTNCVIQLRSEVVNRVSTSLLRVVKYRGSDFSHNEFPYIIKPGGIVINSIPSVKLQNPALGKIISSGHATLDELLGGGYQQSACVLIAGTTGTGKTTLSSLFTRDACSRGERVLYISFEESQEAMVSTMLSPGIDLRPAFEEGLLEMISSMPESMNVEEHLFVAFQKLDSLQPDHIVVDAISACERMGSRQHAYSYLTTLLNECKRRSITCIFVNQVSKMSDLHEITGIGVSSLVDSILFLQFGEEGGELNRTLTVIKSRGVNHSNQFREYCITDQGLEIKEVYLGEGGVLTGVTRQEQEAREETKRQRRIQIIHMQRQELNQKRAALEAKTADSLSEIEVAKAKLDTLEEEEHVWKNSRIERGKMRGAKLANAEITGTATLTE